jgi:Na+-driven multidrug efflux pump
MAEFYIRYFVRVGHIVLAPVAILAIIIAPYLVSLFGYDAETSKMAVECLAVYYGATLLVYPEGFGLTYALRGTGDTKFTMLVSVSTMFLFRIGFAYALEGIFHLGIISIWIAMMSDWFIRGIIYAARFRGGKWKNHNLIHG